MTRTTSASHGPSDSSSRPGRTVHSAVRLTTRLSSRRARLVAGGVLTGLAVGSTTLVLLPDGSSRPTEVSMANGTDATPAPLAVPRREARASRGGARTAPKSVQPKSAPPMKLVSKTVAAGATFSGQASWYGGYFQGRTTANGETFDTNELTAASKTLPFDTKLRVCRLDNCVVVRINDRGPYVGDRVLDLSQAAARQLGYSGVAQVSATPVETKTVAVPDVAAARVIAAREHRAAVVRRARAARLAATKAASKRADLLAAQRAAAQTAVIASNERDDFPLDPMVLPAVGLGMAAAGSLVTLRRRRTAV